MNKPILAPALFISHGAPTFALAPGQLGANLGLLGQSLRGLRAVLVVSPHWQTTRVQVMSTPAPQTIHDFSGFPPPLYQLQYPAPGCPELAQVALELLGAAGIDAGFDAQRGFDHGAWTALYHLLPAAQIPVFQLSMPYSLSTTAAVALGQALAPLRQQGVALIGSGGMTHNLYEFRQSAGPAEPYVLEFTHWVRRAVQTRQFDQLIRYRAIAPQAERAHPTEEHFLPLLVALAASRADESCQCLGSEVTYAVLSMESYGWGLPGAGGGAATGGVATVAS
ncbi:MAG: class III extradiol ring-cleavage dioxygenase [Pseudomonadota bacterium]